MPHMLLQVGEQNLSNSPTFVLIHKFHAPVLLCAMPLWFFLATLHPVQHSWTVPVNVVIFQNCMLSNGSTPGVTLLRMMPVQPGPKIPQRLTDINQIEPHNGKRGLTHFFNCQIFLFSIRAMLRKRTSENRSKKYWELTELWPFKTWRVFSSKIGANPSNSNEHNFSIVHQILIK